MKLLILGANGFIGSEIVKLFIHKPLEGMSITCIDKKVYEQSNIISYAADLSKTNIFDITKEKFDIIINAAAVVGVDTVTENPIYTSENNLNITKNVYKYVLDIKSLDKSYNPLVIFLSSSEVYGNSLKSNPDNHTYNLYTDSSRGIYAITKLLEESYYNVLKEKHHVNNILILRLFNIVGKSQSFNFLFNHILNFIRTAAHVKISKNATRRFCHVDFLTHCLYNIIQTYSNGESVYGTVNFGSYNQNNYIPVRYVILELINKCAEKQVEVQYFNSTQKDIIYRNFDRSKMFGICSDNIIRNIEECREYDKDINTIISEFVKEYKDAK